ncbi:ABC transporter substrate-binding protein [Thiovibrio sp. JS02]
MPLRVFILLCCVFAVLVPAGARCADIVLVQSSNLAPYEEARRGIEDYLATPHTGRGVKSIASSTLSSFLLTDYAAGAELAREINREQPRVAVAIGRDALNFCRDRLSLPTVFLMAPEARDLLGNRKDIVGITMKIQPSRQLTAVAKALPKVQSIGAIYNPQQTGAWVQEALVSGVGDVQALLFRKIAATSDFAKTLAALSVGIQAYWMLPDQLATTPETLQHLLRFSFENRIPIITFSEKYLRQGAALAVTFDIADMGRQAAELAESIANGLSVRDLPASIAPRQIKVVANVRVLEKMGVTVNTTAISESYSGEGWQP